MRYIIYTYLLSFLLFTCSTPISNDNQLKTIDVATIDITLNPSSKAPLAALATLKLKDNYNVAIRVIGKNGPESDVSFDFNEFKNEYTIPILGLYPNYNNEVEFIFKDKTGKNIGKQVEHIQTQPYDGMRMEINSQDDSSPIEPGYLCVSNRDVNVGVYFFDAFGDIRNIYKVPAFHITKLKNGNYLYFNKSQLIEIDKLGITINTIKLPKQFNRIHHDIYEMPDAQTILIPADKSNTTILTADGERDSMEDYLIAVNRKTGQVEEEWDFRTILDVDRATLKIQEDGKDWLHLNSVVFDNRDEVV